MFWKKSQNDFLSKSLFYHWILRNQKHTFEFDNYLHLWIDHLIFSSGWSLTDIQRWLSDSETISNDEGFLCAEY